MPRTTKTDAKSTEEQKAKAKSRSQAISDLVNAHREEFAALLAQRDKANGVTRRVRQSVEEKERAQLAELMAKYGNGAQDLPF